MRIEAAASSSGSSGGALAGLGILVTRPMGQAATLVDLIQQHNGEAIVFPVIEIVAPRDDAALLQALRDLKTVALVIFVSAHAVHRVAELLRRQRRLMPASARVAAIGPTTAAACQRASIAVDFVPRRRVDSEGLLAALSGLQVAGKHVVVFRGQRGRELIKQGLEARGARVHQVESYRRQVTDLPVEALLKRLRAHEIHLATASSIAVVDALAELLGRRHRSLLATTSIAAYSRRVADYCRQSGLGARILTASSPDDAAAVQAMIAWAESAAITMRRRRNTA